MSRILLLVCVVISFSSTFSASAQMTKKETKLWKERIKLLEPEDLRQIMDEYLTYKSKVGHLQLELDSASTKIVEKENALTDKDEQIFVLQQELEEVKKKNIDLVKRDSAKAIAKPYQRENRVLQEEININKGIIYKVQLGVFEHKDLSRFANRPVFGAERENGIYKYTLGVFDDYEMADAFKKHLRDMGATEAWIVSYENGKRVPIQENPFD